MPNPIVSTERPFVLVVGLDLTDTESSGFALDQAARTAMRVPGSQMHLLHVLPVDASRDKARETAGSLERYVSAKATQLGGLARQNVGIHVRCGEAAREIAKLAAEVGADVIVVGTHHRPHLKQLIVGSTAEHVMAASDCPVFVAGPRPVPKASHIIVIEAPCPDCVLARQSTAGKTWWCARHSEHHHLHGHHHYSYQSELPFAQHDSEVRATGV